MAIGAKTKQIGAMEAIHMDAGKALFVLCMVVALVMALISGSMVVMITRVRIPSEWRSRLAIDKSQEEQSNPKKNSQVVGDKVNELAKANHCNKEGTWISGNESDHDKTKKNG
jgi:hypothetical protein